MFKKYYKQANDDIETNRALIDKIFEESEKTTANKSFAAVYKFGMAAAAVLVIAVSTTFVPGLLKPDKTEVAPENIVRIAKDTPQNKTADVAIKHEEKNVKNKEEISETAKKTTQVTKSEPQIKYEKKAEAVTNAEAVKSEQKQESAEANPSIQPIINQTEESEYVEKGNAPVLAMDTATEQSYAIPERARGGGPEFRPSLETKEVSLKDMTQVSQEESEKIASCLEDGLGKENPSTGGQYFFETDGKVQVDGEVVYVGSWSQMTDDSHLSKLHDFVLNESMNEMYSCIHSEDGTLLGNTSNNLLEK